MKKIESGKTVDGYRLLSPLGRGASAQVWEVERVVDKERFAMKIVAPEIGLDEISLDQQIRNFKEFSKLNHDNLLSNIDTGIIGDSPYAIMPICDTSLDLKIRSRSMAIIEETGKLEVTSSIFSEREVVEIMVAASSGLSHLHNRMKKAHHDVKPSNIMMTSTNSGIRYQLADFDVAVDIKQDIIKRTVARKSDQATTTTNGGFSPAYMSNEQCESNYAGDSKSDIFSLGVSLYELAVGKLPAHPSLGQSYFHFGEDVSIPELPRRYFSIPLQKILWDCMSPNPAERPTADQLKSYGQYFLSVGTWPDGLPSHSGRFPIADGMPPANKTKKRPLLKLLLGALAVLAILIAVARFAVIPGYQEDLLMQVDSLLTKKGLEKIPQSIELLDKADILELPEKYRVLQSALTKLNTLVLPDAKGMRGIKQNGTVAVQDKNSGKWDFYHLYCEKYITQEAFDDVSDFTYNYASFQQDDSVGFVDLNGKKYNERKGEIPIVLSDTSGQISGDVLSLPSPVLQPDCVK